MRTQRPSWNAGLVHISERSDQPANVVFTNDVGVKWLHRQTHRPWEFVPFQWFSNWKKKKKPQTGFFFCKPNSGDVTLTGNVHLTHNGGSVGKPTSRLPVLSTLTMRRTIARSSFYDCERRTWFSRATSVRPRPAAVADDDTASQTLIPNRPSQQAPLVQTRRAAEPRPTTRNHYRRPLDYGNEPTSSLRWERMAVTGDAQRHGNRAITGLIDDCRADLTATSSNLSSGDASNRPVWNSTDVFASIKLQMLLRPPPALFSHRRIGN